MVLHPEVQEAAQAELDAVVGKERLPCYDDRRSLPYLEAIILECLRWMPVAQIQFPRMTHDEDEYRGWRIPAGSVVMPVNE